MSRYNLRERINNPWTKFMEKKRNKTDDDDEEYEGPPKKQDIKDLSSEEAKFSEERDSEEESSSEEPLNEDEFTGFIVPDDVLEKETDVDDWMIDNDTILIAIANAILEEYPDLPKEKIIEVVEKTLVRFGEDILEEYCEAVPKDKRWKVGKPDDVVNKVEPILQKIREKIKEEEPTLEKIMLTKTTLGEKKKYLQYFDIYKNTEPYTLDWLDLRSNITGFINSNMVSSQSDIDLLEKEEERILSTTPNFEVSTLKTKILNLQASDVIKARLLEMYRTLMETSRDDTSWRQIKEKLEIAVSLPYSKIKMSEIIFGKNSPQEINEYCANIRKKLDEELYGMEEVKDELICAINNRITNPKSIVTLALKGAAGVGKTACISALAKATGLPFERIPLGGMKDTTVLKGADSHWLGSGPSIILRILKNMKISNGIVLFDEIDKLSDTPHGVEIQNALLHITDYTQNSEFVDTYLSEFPHDISNLWFFYALNDETKMDPILKDRLVILDVPSYSRQDLVQIIQRHLLPRSLINVNIPENSISITEKACMSIINICSQEIQETGVRPVQKLMMKIATRLNLTRTTTLPDGTTGNLKIKYHIPNFSLPFVIDETVVAKLIDQQKKQNLSYFI
jgi:ATP-dependent Lon protease